MKFFTIFQLLVCTVLPPLVFADIKIELETKPGDWSTAQLDLMKKATHIVYKRMPSFKITRCAMRNSTRGKPDKRKWEDQMATMRRGKGLKLKIIKESLSKKTLGQAWVGSATEARHKVGFNTITITLNGHHVGYQYKDRRMSKDLENELKDRYNRETFWAQTIGHEIAHTLGLRHGSKGSYKEAYGGYFITALSSCIMNNGKFR